MNLYRTLTGLRSPPATNQITSPDMEVSEEVAAEVDEPPENSRKWLPIRNPYQKATPSTMNRRESLLTRQLHSETEHSEEDHQMPPRTSISGSVWSRSSVASTAELTSDDGKSVPSPAVSPPLSATYLKSIVPVHEKTSAGVLEIVGQEDTQAARPKVQATVPTEAPRRRCITFACGNKGERPKMVAAPVTPKVEVQPVTPPKRKCMIQFVCSGRNAETKPTTSAVPRRSASPAPSTHKRHALAVATKVHRGSDSTVTHASPQSLRKVSPSNPNPVAVKNTSKPVIFQKVVYDSDSGPESTRFHEFAISRADNDAWTKESTVHRSRLTISDTLRKEEIIRRACEAAEQEAIEEGEDEDDLEERANRDDDDDDDDDDADDGFDDEDEQTPDRAHVTEVDDESDESDDGFHSDNEAGFAESDSEDESDFEWWKPAGRSTAATSIDYAERLPLKVRSEDALVSSVGSMSSGQASPRSSRKQFNKSASRRHKVSHAMDIPRPATPELPDSTDFVAGTLDEDRPLEQAYINTMRGRAAAKHGVRPQDIDPTFPASDPEMDEEDDDDLVDAPPSMDEGMVHGDLDELDGDNTVKPRRSPRGSRRNTTRSPAPPRLRSPAPAAYIARLHSPAPKSRAVHVSPPPPVKRSKQTSPRRMRSPAPPSRKMSPNTTRPATPAPPKHTVSSDTFGLPERVNVTHTASLPRAGAFRRRHMMTTHMDDITGSIDAANTDAPRRGAIDIVRGLERKRQRRREKLHQKLCAKAAAKGEKVYKVKPGRGAERMREVGLELQRYKGKGEHILSV